MKRTSLEVERSGRTRSVCSPVHVPVEAIIVWNQLVLSFVVQFALEVPGTHSQLGLESGVTENYFPFESFLTAHMCWRTGRFGW